jgi:hypothetical protein
MMVVPGCNVTIVKASLLFIERTVVLLFILKLVLDIALQVSVMLTAFGKALLIRCIRALRVRSAMKDGRRHTLDGLSFVIRSPNQYAGKESESNRPDGHDGGGSYPH